MRRRQVFATQSAAPEAALSSLRVIADIAEGSRTINSLPNIARIARETLENGVPPRDVLAVERASLPRGACQKCGKQIGQGLAMHRKHCKGAS